MDYAGMTVAIGNAETGEVWRASVFVVACLPASSYLYTEVQPSQEMCHWINGMCARLHSLVGWRGFCVRTT